MKKIILFCGSVLLLSIFFGTIFSQTKKVPSDTLSVIHSRKSVRHFTGKSVSQQDLIKLVKAGMAAPTAVNMQPWSFVIISERKQLDALAEVLPYAKMLDRAGAAIVVCALPEKAFQGRIEFAIIDSTCAGENILLAAEALGLGALWTAAYPDQERMSQVRKLLNIPENIIPLNVIPVGYPTFEDKPKNKFKAENIHWEKW